MENDERINRQRILVEEIGMHFDKQGFQPVAGRILGLLMVMDKEQFTFDEITEELNISKSSASNALRNLEIRGEIQYKTHPGDRKRYFYLKTQDSFTIIKEFEKKITLFNQLLLNILDLKENKESTNAKHVRRMIKMSDFFMNEIEILKKKFNVDN